MAKWDIDCSKDEVLTQQHTKQEADINFIVERAKRGAEITHLNSRAPVYGDFTELPTDLRDAMNTVVRANEAFMALDARVRERFHNDPAEMMDFLRDSKNREEAVALGVVNAPPAVKVDPVVEEIKALRADLTAGVSGSKKAKAKAETD